MPKVSVIMPVYNTEKYIERAIISLMEQTLDDVEFIIIDDGSKDNSLVIIQQVVERYPNRKNQVILISRENRGVAATRAQGMELAKGEYTIHLDSDDWVESDWLETMYNTANITDSDVVVCDFKLAFENHYVVVNQKPEASGLLCIEQMLDGILHGSTWNKLIKRELCVNNGVNVIENINYLEDFIYVMRIFHCSNKIAYVDKPLLNYNQQNQSSITTFINEYKVNQIVNAINHINGFLIKNDIPSSFYQTLDKFKLTQKAWILFNSTQTSNMMLGLFEESNKMLFAGKFSLYIKITLYLSSLKMYKSTLLFIKLIRSLKRLRSFYMK